MSSAPSSVVPTGAVTRPGARHDVAERCPVVRLKAQVAVGDDPDETPRIVHDRDAADGVPRHALARVADRVLRVENDRVEDHAGLGALNAAHLARLKLGRHVFMEHADAALTRDRDREARLGDRVHRRRDERDREPERPREPGRRVDVARHHVRPAGNEQDVVEGEAFEAILDPWVRRALRGASVDDGFELDLAAQRVDLCGREAAPLATAKALQPEPGVGDPLERLDASCRVPRSCGGPAGCGPRATRARRHAGRARRTARCRLSPAPSSSITPVVRRSRSASVSARSVRQR